MIYIGGLGSEWTSKFQGYMTNIDHCEPLTHGSLALSFYGDFFLFNYLKISLYIGLQEVNSTTQQGAQFPNVTNSWTGGRRGVKNQKI
jgi:hypothetical protein